jgi:hypothetical protein
MNARILAVLGAVALAPVLAAAEERASLAAPQSAAPPTVKPEAPAPAQIPSRSAPAQDKNRAFVERLYQDVLGRPGDANAVAQLTAMLRQGAERRVVVENIVGSDEYRTSRVQDLYTRLVHRAADPRELASRLAFLRGGGTEEQVTAMLIASDEYFQLAGATNASFAERLYTDLMGRPLREPSLAQLAGMLDGSASTRATVAQLILGSDPYINHSINAAYQKYLRRSPDAVATQAFRAPFQQWGSRVVVVTLLASPEYYDRA